MSPERQIVRWESTTDSSLCGVEVTGAALGEPNEAGAEFSNPTFVLASLGSAKPADVAVAISRASAAYGNARPCMALDASAFFALDARFLSERNVGLVLDHVDETTPLNAVSAELIEAVRFEPSFIRRAMKDGRLACVLDAMLRLAHDLGIATLGTSAGRMARAGERFDFDYVSVSTS